MVFLGPPRGEIEVRLVKPPFDAVESARIYFDEYEKLGTPRAEKLSYKSTRYIVPEHTSYAIELTLKKGFDFGEWEGIYVWVYNKVKMSPIGKKKLPKPLGQRDLLLSGKKILVDRLDHAPKDGKLTMNVTLTFRALDTDETLSNETDFPGVAPPDLSDITIRVVRYKNPRIFKVSDTERQRLLKIFQNNMLEQAKVVDETSFSKHGITHAVGLCAWREFNSATCASKKGWVAEYDEVRVVHFLCRSQEFFERKSMAKCPIPAECQPWDYLKEHERKECFKTLQDYDKDRVLRQKIAEAGPGTDGKPIQRQLFELGEMPNRWRGWGQLYKREKQALFENLQLRRSFWEKGEIPPEDKKPEHETETKPTIDTPTIKEELIEKTNQTAPIEVPLPIIKEEPVEKVALPKAKKPQPDIIILDDTPPRVSKRTAANISTSTTPTIKTEPVDFGNFPAAAYSNTHSGSGGGISKKAKLEQGTEISGGDEEKELVKLKEEEQRLEEELLAAQRVADLIRKRNESKARIAALEARASTTPGRGSPS